MDNKNTFVLVHSAWLGGWQWDQVSSILKNEGYTVLTPNLPGHGTDKTPAEKITMESYVTSLISVLDAQNNPVILVGHSFNGITVSRVAELRPEKVKALVYLTAFLLPNGGSFFGAVQGVSGSKAVDNFYLSDDQTYALVKEEEIQNAFAHDIPKEAFEKAKPYIVPEPAAPLGYKLEISEQHFGRIPKYYIECTEDKAIPIAIQRAMYNGKVKKAYSLKSSHTPNFSQADILAYILQKIDYDTQNYNNSLERIFEGKQRLEAFEDSKDSQLFSDYIDSKSAINVHRFFENEHHALAHVESQEKKQRIAEFILFEKNEKGKIIKFYVASQAVPEIHIGEETMFDGFKTVIYNDEELINKNIITRFIEEVWIQGNTGSIQEFFERGKIIQHNPKVANNLDGIVKFLKFMAQNNIQIQYNKLISVMAIGNFIFTYSEGTIGKECHTFADLFRIEKGKIVEHWDVIQKQ